MSFMASDQNSVSGSSSFIAARRSAENVAIPQRRGMYVPMSPTRVGVFKIGFGGMNLTLSGCTNVAGARFVPRAAAVHKEEARRETLRRAGPRGGRAETFPTNWFGLSAGLCAAG